MLSRERGPTHRRAHHHEEPAPPQRPAPGKRARTERLAGPHQIAALERRLDALELVEATLRGPRDDRALAAAVTQEESAGDFPHRSTLERALGAPLAARVHHGAAARTACDALGAEAFVFSDAVAFRDATPSLCTAAHEAAHILQRSRGIAGAVADIEAHADLVADCVVRGENAAHLFGGPRAAADAVACSKPGHRAPQTEIAICQPDASPATDLHADSLAGARSLIDAVDARLVPRFRGAVDCIDAPRAMKAAAELVAVVGEIATRIAEARTAVADTPAVCHPDSTSATSRASTTLDVDSVDAALRDAATRWLTSATVRMFRDRVLVTGADRLPPTPAIPAKLASETATVCDLLMTVAVVRRLVARPNGTATKEERQEAMRFVTSWRSRPADFIFLRHILRTEDLWGPLATATDAGDSLDDLSEDVDAQARATGDFGDVGAFNIDAARDALKSVMGIPIPGRAQEVFSMISSAAPTTRGAILLQLDSEGLLDRLFHEVPWGIVAQLRDHMPDKRVRQRLDSYLEGKGGGESVKAICARKGAQAWTEGRWVDTVRWALAEGLHSAATFAFTEIHDPAYDAREAGLISDATYDNHRSKAGQRSAALLGASGLSGFGGGLMGEGLAGAAGLSPTAMRIAGGLTGGALEGGVGRAVSDAFDGSRSSGANYAFDVGFGALTGGGLAALGGKARSLDKKMPALQAEQFARIDSAFAHGRNATFDVAMGAWGSLQALLGRRGNRLVSEAGHRPAPNLKPGELHVKVMTDGEIRRFVGTIDPVTQVVTVTNPHPVMQGFVGAMDDVDPASLRTTGDFRAALGLDGPAPHYQKYGTERTYLVGFRTPVVADRPFPGMHAEFHRQQVQQGGLQAIAPDGPARIGDVDLVTSHVPGTARTKGGIREGVLPNGSPASLEFIMPIGDTIAPASSASPSFDVAKAPARVVRGVQEIESGLASGALNSALHAEGER